LARRRQSEQPRLMVGSHARYKVCWVATKKAKVRLKKGGTKTVKKPVIIERDFGNDVDGAYALLTRAEAAGKKMATVVCTNVGFPPPEKYADYQVKKVRKKKNGRKVTKEVVWVTVRPMKKVNAAGLTWCPYCRKFRKFQLQDGFRIDGHYVPEKGWHCPICGISHRNHLVRKYNPRMEIEFIKFSTPTRRSRNG
jgi:hypothetical protein